MSSLYDEFLSIDGSVIGSWKDLMNFLEIMREYKEEDDDYDY